MAIARKMSFVASFALALVLCEYVSADVVTTNDGARLIGSITKVTPTAIELKTSYAGDLTVKMDEVSGFTTDAALTTQLTDATTMTGVTLLDAKTLRITGDAMTSTAGLDRLQAAWLPDAEPPNGIVVRSAPLGVHGRRQPDG